MSSPKQLARIAGVLYLIVGVFGGFAIGYSPRWSMRRAMH
jgi:hypothetical protein